MSKIKVNKVVVDCFSHPLLEIEAKAAVVLHNSILKRLSMNGKQ